MWPACAKCGNSWDELLVFLTNCPKCGAAIEDAPIHKAPAASPQQEPVESIPVSDILSEADHIEQNGMAVAKFGGDEVNEGRCRELCAMYLREFVSTKRMSDRLNELYPAPQSVPTEERTIPAVLFDGYRIYSTLEGAAKERNTIHNVADTLDAIVKIMRHDMNGDRNG